MSAADDRNEPSSGNEVDAFSKPLLRTTTWSGHRPGAFERAMYQVYDALRPLIAERLSAEHAYVFAEPVTDVKTGQVFWYAPVAGEAVAYSELTPADQAAVDVRLNQLLSELIDLARKLQTHGKTMEERVFGQLLQIQLDAAYAEKQYLYVVGYQPIVAFWAFEAGYAPNQFASASRGVTLPPGVPRSRQAPVRAARSQTPKPTLEKYGEPAANPDETEWIPPPVEVERQQQTPTASARALGAAWSPRTFGILAVVLALSFFGIFGFSPRNTVIEWLDRVQTLRAREQALLRLIARSERARTEGVSAAELDAEVAAVAPPADHAPAESEDVADEGFYEPAPEPVPPFDSVKGELTLDKIPGAVVILHFWNAADDKGCAELASFASMVGTERFETLREQGAEAYLVTTAESLEAGDKLLRQCGVQDPFLLRDPDGRILKRLSPGSKAPATLVYDKEDERALATYSRRSWTEASAFEELRRLFLMRVF